MMRDTLNWAATAICALAAGFAMAGAARSESLPFIGKWATQPRQCSLPQDDENAPMIVTPKGYDRHEAHCKFTSVRKRGTGWAVKESCAVEGDEQTVDETWTVANGHLTIGDQYGHSSYRLCP